MNRAPALRLLIGAIRAEWWRWSINLVAWSVIWSMPILAGLIGAAFFNRLETDVGLNATSIVALMLGYGLARVVVMVLAMHSDVHFMYRVSSLLRWNMLTRILRRPGAQAVDQSTGEIVTRFRDDVEHVEETATWTVDLAGALSFSIIAGWILWSIDPAMTMLVFLPLLVVVWLAEQAGSRIRRYRIAAREATGRVTEAIAEIFGGVQSIKVAGAERSMIEHLQRLNDERRVLQIKDRVLVAGLESMFWNTINVGIGLILLVGAGKLGDSLGVGDFALFVFVMGIATEVVHIVGLFIARLRQASVSFARMGELMGDVPLETLVAPPTPRLSGPLAPVPAPEPTGDDELKSLEVEGLTFHYPGTTNGIAGVELSLERGSFTVITGRIGSGKTTLLRAVLGLVDADAGEVRWNGSIVDEPGTFLVPPRAAYTPQVPRLFSMTLRENLLLGHDATDDEVMDAIRAAVFGPDLELMPQGLDTEVGPLGVRLSGGQVQRTAAARMLVRKPELLVFDDLSSALDVDTERKLWERLLSANGEVTSLVVSHRHPALRRADQVIVMKSGRVDAVGSLDELLETNEELQRLWVEE